MKFKLDECLDVRLAALFSAEEHDVQTVFDENFSGESDKAIYSICVKEERTLITQDMDFSNPFRFSPLGTQGIIVLRNPSQLLSDSEHLIKNVIRRIHEDNPQGHLWVVDRHGIRIWPMD